MIINLPSRAVIDARKIAGSELIALAERAEAGGGDVLGPVILSCWQRTIDPGPYANVLGPNGKPTVPLLLGDILGGLLELRIASVPYGRMYEFYVRCDQCTERFTHRIDLVADIMPKRVLPLPQDSLATLVSGGTFHDAITDVQGKRHELTYRLQTVADAAPLRELLRSLNRRRPSPVEALAVRIDSIDGVTPVAKEAKDGKKPTVDFKQIQRFLSKCEIDELDLLQARMDAVDCGIDNTIGARCRECNWLQDVDLPFGRTFFRQPRTLLEEMGALGLQKGETESVPSLGDGDPEPQLST